MSHGTSDLPDRRLLRWLRPPVVPLIVRVNGANNVRLVPTMLVSVQSSSPDQLRADCAWFACTSISGSDIGFTGGGHFAFSHGTSVWNV